MTRHDEPAEGGDVAGVAHAEPILIQAARRMATTHPHRHIRIVSGSGTTVSGFVAEFDEFLADLIAKAEQRGREDNADHGMCYVHGSKALEAKRAEARAEGWEDGYRNGQADGDDGRTD